MNIEDDPDDFGAFILSECERLGWGTTWPNRLAPLVLELSELVEAARGKGGDPVEEAGDVIIDVLALFASCGIRWRDAWDAARTKVAERSNMSEAWGRARAL